MKKGISLILLIGLMVLQSVFCSYANDFRNKNYAKSSGLSWENDVKPALEKKVKEESFASYGVTDAIKDMQYIRYICLTHQVGYKEYAKLEKDYTDKMIEEAGINIGLYDEELYRKELRAYTRFNEVVENPDETVLADSGFISTNDMLPFNNHTYADKTKIKGLCAGISSYEVFYYIDKSKLQHLDFTKFYDKIKDNLSYEYVKGLDKKIDASEDSVFGLKGLVYYEPKNDVLRGLVNTKLRGSWVSQEDSAKTSKVTYSDLKDGEKRLIESIIWLQAWQNQRSGEQYCDFVTKGHKDPREDVLADSMIDVLKTELSNKKPVIVGFDSADRNGRHAVLGYKLTQDKKDNNMYYLYLADSNWPADWLGTLQVDIKLCLYKSTYKGKPALYANYSPANGAYTYKGDIEFVNSEGNFINTSVSLDSWGKTISTIKSPIDFFSTTK